MIKTTRNGQKVHPTCPKCGCRLNKINSKVYRHFTIAGITEKDARGCKCTLVDERFVLINHPVF